MRDLQPRAVSILLIATGCASSGPGVVIAGTGPWQSVRFEDCERSANLEVVEDCSTFSGRDDCREWATDILRDNARGHANVLALNESSQPETDELHLVAEVYSCPARALLVPGQELRLGTWVWWMHQHVEVVEVGEHELVCLSTEATRCRTAR